MHYGVIVDVDYKDDLVRCYDEIGANYERDRNNVQLKHCPPPFTKVSRGVPGKVYAMADMENPVILQKKLFICIFIADFGKEVQKFRMQI